MRLLAIVSASLCAFGVIVEAAVNRTATNGWGSTPSQRHYIDQKQALVAIQAGIYRADQIGAPMNIAILDPSSILVAFLHMDNSYIGSIDISQKKAKTVTEFNGLFPSYGLFNRSQPGGDLFGIEETNGGLVVFGGGQPIYDLDGYFIGAVGASGGTVAQDIDVAIHCARAVGSTLETFP